jgi:hypothetical protein
MGVLRRDPWVFDISARVCDALLLGFCKAVAGKRCTVLVVPRNHCAERQ